MSQNTDEMSSQSELAYSANSGQGNGGVPSPSSLPIKLISAAVGLFGVSGILYSVGFLILRSHYSFLGIWAGGSQSATEITEEGGRFFYHLLYLPVAPLARLQWKVVVALLLLGLLWDARRKLTTWLGAWRRRFAKRSTESRIPESGRFRRAAPTLILVLLLVVSVVLLETVWRVTEFRNVLQAPENLPEALKSAPARAGLYYQILGRVLLCGLIAWLGLRFFWPMAEKAQRGLVIAQCVLTLAACSLVPVAYGRLILPAKFRPIQHSSAPSEKLFLVGQTNDALVIWNSVLKQTELLPYTDKDRVVIGSAVDLLE
ncbi:MAG TPA: hypothetical protein VJ810_05970 [Blastocatellia bacterium]|nr:hypothetical protein [Blastocatellia bacterium]